jgi:hypothetical protein
LGGSESLPKTFREGDMYLILVREVGSDHEVVLARVSSNPEKVVEALRGKRLTFYTPNDRRKRSRVCRYDVIRIVEMTS